MGRTFVIVGGDAAGMSAASKAKRDDPEHDVIVFEKGEWVSYAACGMPYFVKGEIDALDDLTAKDPAVFVEDRGIDLRTGHEVTAIDTDRKQVTVDDGNDRFEQSYDNLLLGTGARAIEPPFEGIDLPGVFPMHRMGDADAIDSYIEEHNPQTAVIVGGGYIGIEMAEALAGRGIAVSLFEMLPQILDPFGEALGERVASHLRDQGVVLHLETAVQGFDGQEHVRAVETDDDRFDADIAVVGVGVEPNVELAEAADIERGPTGAIATDEFGRTSATDVFAAGDCAESTHVVTGKPTHVPLGLTANRAGRAIGQTVAGTPTKVGAIAGTAIVKAFELGAARTGILDPERAIEHGFDPVAVTIEAESRAEYYPGGDDLTITLVADGNTTRLLGGSIVGREGVKRIDTIATALHGKMTVTEVQNLDLAYAPPFSPVWDPVLTAAKVLSGKLESRE